MLEPRETDIPALFIIFVVLPLVSYFLLGKWSETAKRKEGVSSISRGEAEEASQVNDMAVGVVMPVMQLPNSVIRQCVRCFDTATTRCSQCKSIWYCSGRCQITHWRQVHKLECHQLGRDYHKPYVKHISSKRSCERVAFAENTEQFSSKYTVKQPSPFNAYPEDIISHPDLIFSESPEDAYRGKCSILLSEQIPRGCKSVDEDLRGTLHESRMIDRESPNAFDSVNKYEFLISSTTAISGTNADDSRIDLKRREHLSHKRIPYSYETNGLNLSSDRSPVKRSIKSRTNPSPNAFEPHKSSKSRAKVQSSSDANINIQTTNESNRNDNIHLQENNRVAKTACQQRIEDSANKRKKVKMIYPYEEFVKCFQFEVFNATPRGLVNCGNSCYVNAVLQCLTCTKPLMIYLLRQLHSRAGCAKDWCLMCELEQLVAMMKENGGPLTPVNILMYIRSLNSQIGDGSQEDAHEFLRLLVASMQSICLESFGGENFVDPKLQETTFIQHMFGGCLRSKVKCLRCHHESERYENIMDLTLEIFGWVESLEDALTQFTTSEDLDGDNMYRCARCAMYVQARKQLRIQEAPNILTIVLKRFQEGNYGKINKCITFPKMLDMIPFMTGTNDIPPLYMLYAVVVHLDTSNASFSGHYVSYVKNLQGNWFRVDDTEVQPVELSQVMSEGAYILFYMRSCPRPVKNCNTKPPRHCTPPNQHPSVSVPSFSREPSLYHHKTDINMSKQVVVRENKSRPSTLNNFTDLSSSDWSHFTSSDDSSFTTESTRDSFSMSDHADLPFSAIFNSLYPVECSSQGSAAACRGVGLVRGSLGTRV